MIKRFHPCLFLPLLVAGTFFVACSNSTAPLDPEAQQKADLAQYDTASAQLALKRSEFLKTGATEMTHFGNQLYWLTYLFNDSPELNSYDNRTNSRTRYAFSIGTRVDWNFSASATTIVTARPDGSTVHYNIYDNSQVNHMRGQLDLPVPTDGSKWYAYSGVDDTLYYVKTTGTAGLYRWVIGDQGTGSLVFTFAEAGLAGLGEFGDIAVDNGVLIFSEAGRLWKVSLWTLPIHAVWLENETEVGGASFDGDGVLYTEVHGPKFYRYSDSKVINIGKLIDSNAYRFNGTFNASHHYNGFGQKYQNYVVYRGQDGIFSYNMTTGAINPIQLTPRSADGDGKWLTFDELDVLDDGTLFLKGLLGTSGGSTGSDGPTLRINKSDWMK